MVVHTDKEFLADIEGELRDYVLEEVNVRSLKTCADPLQYCSLRAEPDYASLGKRLGRGMAKVGKAVKGMSTDQILQFEAQGNITLEGETLGSGDIKVRTLVIAPAQFKGTAEFQNVCLFFDW